MRFPHDVCDEALAYITRMKLSAFIFVTIVFALNVAAQTSPTARAVITLRTSNPNVGWNIGSAKVGDLDCDGKPDTVMLGSEKDEVVVGIVWGSAAKQSQVFVFPVGQARQDAFCSKPTV
jgi:hypothetical protein